MEETDYTVAPGEAGERIDRYLVCKTGEALSRSHFQKLIHDGWVTANGEKVKSGYRVRAGDLIHLRVPEPQAVELVAEDIPLDVVYEDADLVVVNKPRGMVVHPAAGNYRGTLVNALLNHCRDLSGINQALRPGIVHRLDKDTTGLLVVAKNDAAHLHLARQIKDRRIKREYLALVHGHPPGEGTVDAPIGRHPVHRKKMAVEPRRGKPAVTHYRVVERYPGYALVEARLETGRTHQVRVHLAHLGHPLVGDPVYAPRRPRLGLAGQALHARTLGFRHPRTGDYLEFRAPLPGDLENLLERLRNNH